MSCASIKGSHFGRVTGFSMAQAAKSWPPTVFLRVHPSPCLRMFYRGAICLARTHFFLFLLLPLLFSCLLGSFFSTCCTPLLSCSWSLFRLTGMVGTGSKDARSACFLRHQNEACRTWDMLMGGLVVGRRRAVVVA